MNKLTQNKILQRFLLRRVSEKVSIGMIVLASFLVILVGLSIHDLRSFREDINTLNTSVLPNITSSAEVAASLQTTLSNVNKLNAVESQAQRRLIIIDLTQEIEQTDSLVRNMNYTNVAQEILLNLLISIKQSVNQLNIIVENRISSKEIMDQAVVDFIQYDVDFITNRFQGATPREVEILGEWEHYLDQIASSVVTSSRKTRMRDVLKSKNQSIAVLNSIPDYSKQVSPVINAHILKVSKKVGELAFGEDGLYNKIITYLSNVARSRGLENQTSLLTDEANLLVKSIFSQTRLTAQNQSKDVSQKLDNHTGYILLYTIFVLIAISAVYLFFRWDIVSRLAKLNNQVLQRVNGIRAPINVHGSDEISDIAKSIGYFMFEIDSQHTKLTEALEQAESANNSKTEFLANISHDIRTPLTGIKGALSLISNTKITENQRILIEKAQISAEILHSLINDLLDISRLEKGMLSLHKAGVELRKLVHDVVTMMDEIRKEKGLGMDIFIDDDVPDYIYTDPKRISQVIFNLVNNAIKFTDIGSVNIYVSMERDAKNKKLIQFRVVDTGMGIAKDQQLVIFDRFQRTKNPKIHNQESMGLGLSICKFLIELMNGTISLKSQVNKGTTFTITMPYEPFTLPKADENIKNSASIKAQKNILVVEDNDINKQLIKMLMETEGHNVTLVSNGREAIERVKQFNYDLILMDVQMPIMNGKEATQHIRAMQKPKCDVPILALTAHAMDFEADQLLSIGMNDIITKPIDTQFLHQAIQKYSL